MWVCIIDLSECLNVWKIYTDENTWIVVNRRRVDRRIQLNGFKFRSMRLYGLKCKVVYFDKDYLLVNGLWIKQKNYAIDENASKMVLKESETEKGLGVIIIANAKCSTSASAKCLNSRLFLEEIDCDKIKNNQPFGFLINKHSFYVWI